MKSLAFFLVLAIYSVGFSQEFILMTTLYDEKNFSRKEEYKQCLLTNIQNPYIKKIIVFFENPYESEFFEELQQLINNIKIQYVEIGERPSFSFFFDYANQNCINKNIIVCNADIFFDHSLKLISEKHLKSTFISLTRYEKINDSYDVFITGFAIAEFKFLAHQPVFETYV